MAFSISTFFHFIFDNTRRGYIRASTTINGLYCHTFLIGLQRGLVLPPQKLAYPTGKVSIKSNKIKDLEKLKPYVPEEHLEFYEEILKWLVNNDNVDD